MVGNVTPEGTRNAYSFSHMLLMGICCVTVVYLIEIIRSNYEQEHPLAHFLQDYYQDSHRKTLEENIFGFLQ